MLTARDAQQIQEVDDHDVPSSDPADNPVEDSLRRQLFDGKAKRPDAQATALMIIVYGRSDEEYEFYAEALRDNRFEVQLDHGYHDCEPLRFHRFYIEWHYSVTGGKLF